MNHTERKRLEKLLASLDTNERNRIYKRAAKMRGTSNGKRGKAHVRSRRPKHRADHDDMDDGKLRDGMRRRGESLHDFALAVLASEEGATIDAANGPSSSNIPGVTYEATVLAIGPGTCDVVVDGNRVQCTLDASIRKRQQSAVAVGDRAIVRDVLEHRIVTAIAPRTSELVRQDSHDQRRERVLVANVELVVVVSTLRQPPLSPGMVDRFLVAIERGRAKPIVCVNKIDLIPTEERADADRQLDDLRSRGIPVVLCSASTGEGMDELSHALAGRFCAFVGRSGAGKSSLLNRIREYGRLNHVHGADQTDEILEEPRDHARTGDVRASDGKGRHTTTRAELIEFSDGTRIIDTPGIRTLALGAIDVPEIEKHFPDIARLANQCRFRDCTHVHEPECAVRTAAHEGSIDSDRLKSFLKLIGEDAG
ncbi:MAG: ribosome small subunit-dependent GTPase A [Planctomycetes bacterium]|nr:ribosome small subunit-dependent GTPase A [Planctomycetota bacterium]MCB9919262.1 ribosome small subunit-dependent GTPase A [Planctomycetota bacterium]